MAHIHELIDFVVSVFIVNNNSVLLVHHKKLDKWLPIGGHIELDEDPEHALFREVEEECGLKIDIIGKKPDLKTDKTKFLFAPQFLDIHKISETHRHVGLIYVATSKSNKVKLKKDEHYNIKWFRVDEIKKSDLLPAVKFYCMEALKKASGIHA